MGTLFQEMIEANDYINKEFGYPTFTWNGASYPCIGSPVEVKRDLEFGGFVIDLLLVITVNRYNSCGQALFPNDVIPSPQQHLTMNGKDFRIEGVNQSEVYNHCNGVQTSPNGATFRITAVSPNKGL